MLHEFRLEVTIHPQQILRHHDLAVHIGAGANAHDRDGHRVPDRLAHRVGDTFHHDADHAGLLQRDGILHQLFCALRRTALNFEAAEARAGLGCHADMSHDRDARVHHAPDGGCHLTAALQLDAVTVGLHQQPVRAGNGLLRADIVGAEGHISDDKRIRSALHHRPGILDHIIQRDSHRAGVAQHDHGQGIAD